MEIIKKRIADMERAEYNPRVELMPGDDEYEKLKRNIDRFGVVVPVIWNKRTNRVVSGHQRLTVLMNEGVTETDVSVVDIDETAEKQLNIAMNKVTGEWDEVKLKELLDGLGDAAPDRRGFIHETLKKYGADREFEYHDLFHSPGFVYEKPAAATWGAFACILITRQRRCSGLEAPASHRKAPYSGLRARSLAARDRAESEERRTMPNRTKDDLWERQPGESAQAYEAFAIYRDMGSNRSLRVVAEQLSKSDTLIKRWSREKKWGERCRAYDNHLDDVARQEALRKYKKMRTRHIGIALQLQEKALAELKNLPDGSMTPKDIIQFLDKATELERDNRMEEAGVTAGGKTAEEQEETTLSLADEIAAAYENRKRGEQT